MPFSIPLSLKSHSASCIHFLLRKRGQPHLLTRGALGSRCPRMGNWSPCWHDEAAHLISGRTWGESWGWVCASAGCSLPHPAWHPWATALDRRDRHLFTTTPPAAGGRASRTCKAAGRFACAAPAGILEGGRITSIPERRLRLGLRDSGRGCPTALPRFPSWAA